MGSQHPPLAALYLLELLGEYPFWGICRGYLGSGYKGEDVSIRSLGLTQAYMSPLWSITEGWGHQDPCVIPQPQLGSGPCLSHHKGPTSPSLLHFWRVGDLTVPFQVESILRSGSEPRIQVVQLSFNAGFPLQLPTHTPAL